MRELLRKGVWGVAVMGLAVGGRAGPLAAQTEPIRVSIAELRDEIAAGRSLLVLFSSDDPGCGFCAAANRDVPAIVGQVQPPANLFLVSWSPWRSFPAELATLPLRQRIRGVPHLVRFRDGRAQWELEGHSAELMAELERRLRAETDAPPPPTANPAARAPASRAPAERAAGAPPASLRLEPARTALLWGVSWRPTVVALDSLGRAVGLPEAAWTSSDTSVASVSPEGIVVTHRRGQAVITLTSGTLRSTVDLTVTGFEALGRATSGLPCAITDGRQQVFCWGEARLLPTARATERRDLPSPLARGDVPADARIAQVVTASTHACLRTEAGTLHCWGRHKDGAVGTGDLAPREAPTRIARGELPAGARLTDVALSPTGTCAIADGRALYCWGARGALPLRAQFRTNDQLPAPVATERGALPVGATLSGLAISINGGCVLADGHPYCWTRASGAPVRLDAGDLRGGTRLEELQSDDFSCGRGSDGEAYCWGSARGHRFGTGTATFLAQRDPLAAARGARPQGIRFTRVTLGSISGANCGVGTDGEAYCWGSGLNGTAGDGRIDRHEVPLPARVRPGERPAGVRLVDLNCGNQYCTALGDDGVLYGWGIALGDVLARPGLRGPVSEPVRAAGTIPTR